ncbi:alpha/beta hydrolase [Eubacteriales bacterium OttesenSCG-928-K08]|nr:alpha/beta hydrolase [Eubacteriales bacterium OttesenSCG-928-K08]
MSLALQMKKFINSEHMGDYAQITLPGFADKNGNVQPEETRIHYAEAGVGEPLILIHTVGQNIYTWRNVFFQLAEHYRVFALDLLGHGYSGRPEQFDYTIPEHSETIGMFMDAKGLESAHFVGFSMGAMYVLDFIVKNPDRVGKTILLAPGGVTPEMPLSIRMLSSSMLGGLASRLYTRRTVERCLGECFFDLTNINAEMLDGYYATMAGTNSRKAIQYCISGFDEADVEANMRNVQTSVLVLWGADDKWHPTEGSEIFHIAITDAQFGVIRNAGHLMHEEKAQRFIESVLEYIPAPVIE